MFEPQYTITNKTITNIREIGELIGELNSQPPPQPILAELKKEARELSTFSSVSIEGNPLSLTEIRQILKNKPEHIIDTEREVLNYNNALLWISKKTETEGPLLSNKKILKTQKKVIEKLLKNPSNIGKYRKEPVMIRDQQIKNGITYLAPDYQEVQTLMKDLINFINKNSNKIDPLILAGIFHRQFIIIHPFLDGNGRTARLVTSSLLAQLGLNFFNLFSFENYYHNDITKYFFKVGLIGDYYELLDNNKINFTDWLEYFTEGIINELSRLQKILLTKRSIRLEKYHKQIITFLQENGTMRASEYEQLTDRKPATRKKDFLKLMELKIIERKGKNRGIYYILKNPTA